MGCEFILLEFLECLSLFKESTLLLSFGEKRNAEEKRKGLFKSCSVKPGGNFGDFFGEGVVLGPSVIVILDIS